MAEPSTDRELLTAAAEAAGLRITWGEKYMIGGDEVDCTDLPYTVSDDREESPAYWNPLEDDGDALRLLAKLRLQVDYRPGFVGVCKSFGPYIGQCPHDEDKPDDTAATRRAIVRAAAAIRSLAGERKGTPHHE